MLMRMGPESLRARCVSTLSAGLWIWAGACLIVYRLLCVTLKSISVCCTFNSLHSLCVCVRVCEVRDCKDCKTTVLVWIFGPWVACVHSVIQRLQHELMIELDILLRSLCFVVTVSTWRRERRNRGVRVGGGGRERRGTDVCVIRANTLDLICYSEDNDLKLGGVRGAGREEREIGGKS